MSNSILTNDIYLKHKFDDYKGFLRTTFCDAVSNKNLKTDFFKKRRKTLCKNINKNFGNEPLLTQTSTEDLAKLFALLAKYPDQISKIERVLSSYKVDISILDEESLKSIFDEVKVLTLFK